MPDLLPVPQHRAVVASATRIQLSEGAAARTQVGKRQGWQADAWSYFQEIPEIKFGCLYLANALSRVTFFAGVVSVDGQVVPIDDEASPLYGTALATAAVTEMGRLRGQSGGQGRVNWLATLNSEVVGEFFIHGEQAIPERGRPGEPDYVAARPEAWSVRSISQVTEAKGQAGVLSFVLKGHPDDKGRPVDPLTETLVRIWQEDPQWTDLADCHMRALLSDCELLTLLTNQQKAEAKSRQAPGILLVPSELSFAEDTAVEDGGDDGEQLQQNPFVASLMRALTEPIEDPSAVSAVMPLVISAPKEYLTPDVFRLLSLARTSDTELDKRIDGRIQRLARGMNVPVEVIMGSQQTTFANAAQISEDKFKDHVQPRCQMLADGYEFGFLIPNLAALGYTPEDLAAVRVGYDTGVLTAAPNAEENADALWAAGVISQEAYRRLKGADEADAPGEQEVLFNLASRKGIFTSDLTTIVLEKGGVNLGVDVLATGTIVPTDQPTEVTDQTVPSAAPVAGSARSTDAARRIAVGRHPTLGQKLTDIDRQLFARLQGAVEAAMERALERAGNRIKARRGAPIAASARTIPARQVCESLGIEAVTAAGFSSDELLAGAWDDFGKQFKSWVRASGREALEAVSKTLSGLSEAQRDAGQLRLLAGADEAWAWMQNALSKAGGNILFNAERGAVTSIDAVGEWLAEFRVPSGIIREAMALAGGATNMRGEAGILKTGDGTVVGGVATGDVIQDAISDGGGTIEGYRWNYGPGRRQEFPPHAALDGVTFVNFDDEILANFEGWPEEPYYFPGDHDGCICDFTLEVLTPDEAAQAGNADYMAAADDVLDDGAPDDQVDNFDPDAYSDLKPQRASETLVVKAHY